MTTDRRQISVTGITGLDEILHGGLPANRLYLIEGSPGAGKTTLALQFLLAGASQNQKGLYVTLSETREELEEVAFSHGWDLSLISLVDLSGMSQDLAPERETTFFRPSEVELNRTTGYLMDIVNREAPARVVFDSLSELRLLAETPLRYRRQVLQFKQFFAGRKCTVLFLDDRTASTAQDEQILSIAHGVVSLERRDPEYGVARRTLNVVKVRGLKFREGFHDFSIERGGLVVFPRLVAPAKPQDFPREFFPSGIKELDDMFGGGLDRGTSTMFMGPPGSGKSTLALQYAIQAARRGERVQCYLFDETVGTFSARAKALFPGLDEYLAAGLLKVEFINPAAISPGELSHRVQLGVNQHNARLVIIDSLNGYLNAMPEERFLNLQLHELLAFLNQRGVLSIMVLAQQGLIGPMHSQVDLTYLADTVVLLRFFESRGTVNQAISVIKKRSGNHERTIRQLQINPSGLEIGPPLREFQGILTGTPEFTGRDGSNSGLKYPESP